MQHDHPATASPEALRHDDDSATLYRFRHRVQRRFDEAILRVCRYALRRLDRGHLRLTLPSGASALLGGARPGADASLELRSYRVFWDAMRRGSIGFADCYMDGAVDTSDLLTLFGFFLDNRQALKSAGRGQFRVRIQDRTYHARRRNTKAGSQRNIEAHYDLGNDFYRLWLDPGMTYSSGLHETPGSTLEAAQNAKYQRIMTALDLVPGHSLLEIGCGWGTFAALAARRGALVTGLTLSRQQLGAARALLAGQGLDQLCEIRLEDYRDTTGTFDRIASIEMIEAVGAENWPAYFSTINDRLAAGGIAVLQAITIAPEVYETYRGKPDFIQRYIFPGGMLPTPDLIRAHAQATGLGYERVTTFAASYARTLSMWRTRFHAAWPRIEALGFDARFKRMWDYYLAYCEAGFASGTIDVGIYRLTKLTGQAGKGKSAAVRVEECAACHTK